jgi:hypothetical protein
MASVAFFLSVHHAFIIGDPGKKQRMEEMPQVANSPEAGQVEIRH